MKKKPCYCVAYQVVLARIDNGIIAGTTRTDYSLQTDTEEPNEVFADLYARFRSPRLLGLQILSILPTPVASPVR
ncbi:hypothetical protein PK28_17345 (plasmid) [Hymenobacter sp. DG25B]|uniref:hypothetical protein n=1 Tax=Hymenobacter sp. DG25B TaxID=1385664 RepID=UPI00054099A4|nr:hypothetical protein [Hymenobacter sp. DG25B]AIZ65429.1 hypothetical protein PK28_17345 [Hymenobacter sp. DG25B]